ncbi:MAG TPA: hypothetical protein VFO58_20075 [Vicinamibacterales bacterium]|nr:hypothetical protein [Vicinamibacterales bacterium]
MAVSSRLSGWAAVLLGVAMTASLSAGCAKARAATVPDGPPLAMPLPPPRVFSPLEEEPLAASPAVAEPAASGAPQVTQKQDRAANRPSREPEKAEAPPPPAPAPVVEPARELRAASTPADAEADRKIRLLLNAAKGNLEKVNYGKLSTAGKEQFDQARNFATQGDEALTQRNYVFAETLADRAAKLATELLGLSR